MRVTSQEERTESERKKKEILLRQREREKQVVRSSQEEEGGKKRHEKLGQRGKSRDGKNSFEMKNKRGAKRTDSFLLSLSLSLFQGISVNARRETGANVSRGSCSSTIISSRSSSLSLILRENVLRSHYCLFPMTMMLRCLRLCVFVLCVKRERERERERGRERERLTGA